jgi:transcriptional regulator with XRE-family HTH domain
MKGQSVVGKRLREARLRAGLSQKKLGILAGIDEFSASPRINQYERARHTPEFSTAERLAKVLAIPTPFLYCRDDELASWILAFSRASIRDRQLVLKKSQP